MKLMFWKKAATSENDGAAEGQDDETSAESGKPGLLARLKSVLEKLLGHRRKGGEAEPSEGAEPAVDTRQSRDGKTDAEPPATPLRNKKKRLVLGAALAVSIFLVTAIGFATWKLLLAPSPRPDQQKPAESRTPDAHQAPAAHPPSEVRGFPGDRAQMQVQIEALKERNAQMERELEALKKEKHNETARPAEQDNPAAPAPPGGELIFSSKDPKASAQALKQAIEEMNAATSGKPRKPAE